jgi:hypothetical protein
MRIVAYGTDKYTGIIFRVKIKSRNVKVNPDEYVPP